MQTCLEKNGIESRSEQIVRNDYTKSDEYSSLHKNALSDGDPQGKGTGHGGHTHSIPDCNKGRGIDYSNFDTMNGGGEFDIDGRNGIGGRNFLKSISKYNENYEYGPQLINTMANIADGQITL